MRLLKSLLCNVLQIVFLVLTFSATGFAQTQEKNACNDPEFFVGLFRGPYIKRTMFFARVCCENNSVERKNRHENTDDFVIRLSQGDSIMLKTIHREVRTDPNDNRKRYIHTSGRDITISCETKTEGDCPSYLVGENSVEFKDEYKLIHKYINLQAYYNYEPTNKDGDLFTNVTSFHPQT